MQWIVIRAVVSAVLFGAGVLAGTLAVPKPVGLKAVSYRANTDPKTLLVCLEMEEGKMRCGEYVEFQQLLGPTGQPELPTFEPEPQNGKLEL